MFRFQLDIENMSASVDPKYKQDPAWVYLRQTPEEMIALQSRMKFDAKKSVWVADPEEGFITAEIKSSKGEQIVVVTSKDSEKTLSKDEVQQMNPPKYELIEDMADLTFLNEASVLHNLRQRYYTMMIYTYSGLFCVVINPYRRLPIYSEAVCRMYIGRRRNEMPPHLFSVCDEAYRNMVNDHENQSMLITGESGAGKTENTKKVISYFAIVGSANKKKLADKVIASPLTNGPATSGKKDTSLEEQVVRTNPVLEAFGNAKTVRNNNSSRFGKFIRIHFNTKGKLAGADIEHYLLEKSRVIKQASGERSYHIFYQLMSDAVPDLRKKLYLTKTIRDYHFVSCAEVTIEGVNDKEEMGITDESFDIMNFTQQEKFDIFALTAGIMHMGEIKWKQRPREEQAECEDMVEGELACKLFKVDINKFVGAFLKPRVKVGSEWVNKGQTLEQVTYSVGALAKALYARMFHWLIIRCNATLDAKDFSRNFFIGVLDIAGFEIFDLNSFEQLWINFVNERLQQFFNHHMFVLEQEEYTREGIKWEFIDFGLDLQACIELIEKPLGMISMLDEECIVPKATDLTLAQKLIDQHLGKHPNFQKAKPPKGKQAEAHFAIVHYAGTVRYNVKFWLEKNKDPLNDSVVTVLKGNDGMALLSSIWESYQTQEDTAESEKRVKAKGTVGDKDAKTTTKKKGKSSSFMTVSMIYRESLNNLMNMLNQTHPHFIRCIIPNEQKKAGVIEANLVLNQLTCNGVLEGIRICRKGYPNRVTYPDFKQRYAILAANLAGCDKDAKVAGKKMCAELEKRQQLKVEEYQCGSTKIFFRAGVLAHLEELRDEALSAIIGQFQRACRHYLAAARYRELLNQQVGTKVLQRNVRKWCTLRHWPWFALLNRVKPLIKAGRKDEEFDELSKRCKDMESQFQKEEKLRREMEATNAKLVADKLDLGLQLEREKEALAESEARSAKLLALKSEMEKQLTDLNDQLADQEDKCGTLTKAKKKLELDNDTLKKSVKELDAIIKKQEMEKQSKDHQIRSLQDEAGRQDECIAKLNKEKKHQEEVNRKLQDDLHAEEEKLAHMARTKTKLEQQLDQLEDTLEREKRARQELDKQRRKAEGELKVAQENFEELSRQKQDVEQAVKKREAELVAVTSRLEDEQSLVARLQRQIKELLARVQELEEELAAERQARAKAEKMRNELQIELEELGDRLDEAGGATHAQIELNKKREAEIVKLRRDVEEQAVLNDQQLNQMRKKHQDAVAELSDQIDAVHKSRTKVEKEKAELQREVDELQVQIDAEVKQRQNIDRLAKQLETQLLDSQLRGDEQARQLHELLNWKSRTTNELGDMTRQLEEAESQVSAVSRVKSQLAQQVEEQRRQLDATEKERQQMASQVSNYQLECQQLREQLEEERDGKTELQRLLSKANAEMQQWRAKFEGEGLNRAEELEDAKRRLQVRMHEVQEQFEQANLRIASMEKARQRQQQELEDAQLDAERAHSLANALDKKQKGFDKIVEEWKRKADSLGAELEASQQETRNANTEVFRLRGALDEAVEQIDAVKRENKALEQELKDLTDQLGEGGKNVYDAQKAQRRLELEKEELQQALEDAEAALEAEESKVLRAQVEISQIRAEIEKRIAEKEEEFENTRKNHQRAMDSMQASLEAEARGRAELAKAKKKLEIDINELEISLDQANKANVDAQRNLKRYQETIRELQQQIDEEQHSRDELRDQLMLVEKRSQMVQQEKEELATAFELTDRARRQAETEAQDARETANSLASTNISLTALRRKLETDLQHSQTELSEALAELKTADERTKKAFLDAARLAEELRVEQEHAQSQERQKKALDAQLKDLQLRLEDAEAQAMKGGKKTVAKLEQKLREVEVELQEESRRHQETHKNLRNKDRRVRELQFQVEEDKKSTERMYDLVEKLQAKLKTYKRQAEEAEQLASVNLTKYRQIQHLLEDAEERADIAENSLTKMRTKSRSSIVSIGGGTTRLFPASRSGLLHSASSAALMHSASAMNNHVNHYPSQQVARSRSGEVIAEETE